MSARELFQGYIDAYNARDVDRMLSHFAENCVFENISAGKLTVRTQGKPELERLARKSAAAFGWRDQRLQTVLQEQQMLVAEIEFRGELKSDFGPDMKAGTVLQLRGVSVVQFAGRKIARLTDYS